uniref:site-specific DNA-methyltransferase (cytosine-N(4)-specific) n=1 Tax=Parageobacillus thermoglucosidasius TaxID=1426 RepID=Q2I0M1_PARTM|nr:M1.BtsI [Parageobacillus thermoglucosidasius]
MIKRYYCFYFTSERVIVMAISALDKIDMNKFVYGDESFNFIPAPYVLNSPADQNDFHNTLIHIQQHKNPKISRDKYLKRLSMVETILPDQIKTAQTILESPKKNAKSWSSNYGTHGWHRYVGRFPPHLVRALLNYFQADSNDIVLDPFVGSGTTLVECRLLGIPAIGIEICPLSAMISRSKSQYTLEMADYLPELIAEFEEFYKTSWANFIGTRDLATVSYEEIIARPGNYIEAFTNYEKWFIKEALLGVSIAIEFATRLNGNLKDLFLVALSSKMRSIGNVDVDVVRAEYSKKPREKVDVLDLVVKQLKKMRKSIIDSYMSHSDFILDKDSIKVIENDVLQVNDIDNESISFIITSPPYGVEAISYLRTHLLSYRTLDHFLGVDPYKFGANVIGSEYLPSEVPEVTDFEVAKISKTYRDFFDQVLKNNLNKNMKVRTLMMMKFFEDMRKVAERFQKWLKTGGKVAFVIGNNKIGNTIIPTDKIISEIFQWYRLDLIKSINHKLKSNNSNSKVPWQDRIIQDEFILIFQKAG